MYCFIPDLPLNFTMCSSMLCSRLFNSTSGNFEFRWPITGLILKTLPVSKSFLLSAKCRFWRISQKRFRVIEFWISSLLIRLSTLQYQAIMGNLLIVISKFIPRNTFGSSLETVKFLPFHKHKDLIVQLSIRAALWDRSPKKIFLLGKLFHLDWIAFLARGDALLAWKCLLFWSSFIFLLFWFFFFFDCLSACTTWRLASGVDKEVPCVLAACEISSSAINWLSESFIKLSVSSSTPLSTSSNKASICSLLVFSSIWNYLFLPLVAISSQKTKHI